MASWREFFGGNYLTAEKFGNKKLKSKIIAISPETISAKGKEDQTKLVAELNNLPQKLSLNKTNCEILSAKFGDNYEKWVGKMIEIYTDWTQFEGKKVKGLFVRPLGGK